MNNLEFEYNPTNGNYVLVDKLTGTRYFAMVIDIGMCNKKSEDIMEIIIPLKCTGADEFLQGWLDYNHCCKKYNQGIRTESILSRLHAYSTFDFHGRDGKLTEMFIHCSLLEKNKLSDLTDTSLLLPNEINNANIIYIYIEIWQRIEEVIINKKYNDDGPTDWEDFINNLS